MRRVLGTLLNSLSSQLSSGMAQHANAYASSWASAPLSAARAYEAGGLELLCGDAQACEAARVAALAKANPLAQFSLEHSRWANLTAAEFSRMHGLLHVGGHVRDREPVRKLQSTAQE